MWRAGIVGDSKPDQLVGPYWFRIDDVNSINEGVSQATDQLGSTFTAFSRNVYSGSSWVVVSIINKVDRYGDVIWYKEITVQGNLPSFTSAIPKLNFTQDGNLLVSTFTVENTSTNDVGVVIKINQASGEAMWQRTVSSTQSLVLFEAIEASNGSLYLWGSIQKPTDSRRFPLIVKLASDGTVLWSKAFSTGSQDAYGSQMNLGSDGYLYLAAVDNYTAYRIYKVSAEGTVSWEKVAPFGTPLGFSGSCEWDHLNNFYLLYGGAGEAGVMKFDSSGLLLWQKKLASNVDTWGEKFPPLNGLSIDLQGNIYAAFMGGRMQTWSNISKLTSEGVLVWNRILTYGYQSSLNSQQGGITSSVSVDVDNNLRLHTSGNKAINAKLPIDGTRVGTYSFGPSLRYLDSPMSATSDTHTTESKNTTYYYPTISIDTTLYASTASVSPWTETFKIQMA
jgi:hypothetical protein